MALRKLEIVEYYDRNGILKLTLNRHPYFADTKKLKDWTYGYDQRYGKIENFYRSKNEYELNIGVAGDSLAARDELSDIFNADVLAGEPGTLKIRGWALKCYITEAEYEFGVRIDRTSKYKVIAVTPGWTREAVHSYDGTETGGSGTDYGRNYSFNSNVLGRGYDYGYDEYAAHSATITLTGDNNGFELMIYGPAIDPVVYVNNDPVKVFVTLNSTERLRIVSDGSIKTIDVLQSAGSSESAFVFRDKEHNPFITLGKETELTFGEIKFDFTTIERRSEPSWT